MDIYVILKQGDVKNLHTFYSPHIWCECDLINGESPDKPTFSFNLDRV